MLSSHYFLAVRNESQIQSRAFHVKLIPLAAYYYNINQPLFTCSNSSELLVISLRKVNKLKVNYTVLSY